MCKTSILDCFELFRNQIDAFRCTANTEGVDLRGLSLFIEYFLFFNFNFLDFNFPPTKEKGSSPQGANNKRAAKFCFKCRTSTVPPHHIHTQTHAHAHTHT